MISQDQKTKVIQSFKVHETDTGSASVQVAVLTARIQQLTDHLRVHRKDFSTRRGLLKLVGRRRRLLTYLKKTDLNQYGQLISRLSLRK